MTGKGIDEPHRGRWERIYAVVRRIPRGRVATYGQVAKLAGLEGHARQVGYALHVLPRESLVPWHRVINRRGEISLRPGGGFDVTQRLLLDREGVRFDSGGRVDLKLFGWKPAGPLGPPRAVSASSARHAASRRRLTSGG